MTNPRATAAPARLLVCAECGTEFGCDMSANCWCMAEPVSLPMPTAGGDCLCRICLRKKAAARDQVVDS